MSSHSGALLAAFRNRRLLLWLFAGFLCGLLDELLASLPLAKEAQVS